MPQPFEQFSMQQLSEFTKEQFRHEARKLTEDKSPLHLKNSMKIADLAHFLIHNFKDELSSEEHVVDTAIRLLKKVAQ